MTPRGETGFILTFQDVTESRKLEREARTQQRLAAVGEMAAGIAHEIGIRWRRCRARFRSCGRNCR